MSTPSHEDNADLVLCDVAGGVARIRLNQPGRRNAMSVDMASALVDALRAVEAEPEVRVVVVGGEGDHFCVGADLGVPRSRRVVRRTSWDADRARLLHLATVGELLHRMPKPTIAAVDGGCAGVGMAVALAADLRIVSERARFNTAYVAAGLSGDGGLVWYLTQVVGPAKARELCLLPDRISAQQAVEMGIANEVATMPEFPGRVDAVAARLAASAPLALRGMKLNLGSAPTTGLGDYLAVEAERLLVCGYSADADEAAVAFTAKRDPVFTGR